MDPFKNFKYVTDPSVKKICLNVNYYKIYSILLFKYFYFNNITVDRYLYVPGYKIIIVIEENKIFNVNAVAAFP